MQVKLVFIRFGVVQHFNVAALHAHGKPLTGGAVTQREDLGSEVVLLELSSFPKVPGTHCVVQTTCP